LTEQYQSLFEEKKRQEENYERELDELIVGNNKLES
jgi:hypothetical protein